ncbi:hypothetical protein [Alkalimarinus alittae]|uniref:DUF432 domain-containing protein n=1 Tax=Alkalimarinus alittae TaxID=2961619 RepID=A0ABY6MXN0_9ALTE|nr:hypothetical protein [Alkalimarinus alittae]UZE94537.1 hypothetical protein NKI27_10600 [Alkalimarinus alittae]
MTENLWEETNTFEPQTTYKLSVGALELYINLLENEWTFRHSYLTQDETKTEKKIELSALKKNTRDDLDPLRFINANQQKTLQFRPRLANKSIVAKPYMPVFLPSQQTVTIYISTPIWLAIFFEGHKQPLLELPTFKLSDTWFGPRPHKGELCYSSRFSGRIDLKALPKRASRIITPVKITNNGADNLKLEKISIPCDYLAVYLNKNNELWTPTLSILREVDQNKTKVAIEKTLHPSLEQARRVGEPRVADPSRLLSKTIDMLFS